MTDRHISPLASILLAPADTEITPLRLTAHGQQVITRRDEAVELIDLTQEVPDATQALLVISRSSREFVESTLKVFLKNETAGSGDFVFHKAYGIYLHAPSHFDEIQAIASELMVQSSTRSINQTELQGSLVGGALGKAPRFEDITITSAGEYLIGGIDYPVSLTEGLRVRTHATDYSFSMPKGSDRGYTTEPGTYLTSTIAYKSNSDADDPFQNRGVVKTANINQNDVVCEMTRTNDHIPNNAHGRFRVNVNINGMRCLQGANASSEFGLMLRITTVGKAAFNSCTATSYSHTYKMDFNTLSSTVDANPAVSFDFKAEFDTQHEVLDKIEVYSDNVNTYELSLADTTLFFQTEFLDCEPCSMNGLGIILCDNFENRILKVMCAGVYNAIPRPQMQNLLGKGGDYYPLPQEEITQLTSYAQTILPSAFKLSENHLPMVRAAASREEIQRHTGFLSTMKGALKKAGQMIYDNRYDLAKGVNRLLSQSNNPRAVMAGQALESGVTRFTSGAEDDSPPREDDIVRYTASPHVNIEVGEGNCAKCCGGQSSTSDEEDLFEGVQEHAYDLAQKVGEKIEALSKKGEKSKKLDRCQKHTKAILATSSRFKNPLTLEISTKKIEEYLTSNPPTKAEDIGLALRIDKKIVNKILYDLEYRGLAKHQKPHTRETLWRIPDEIALERTDSELFSEPEGNEEAPEPEFSSDNITRHTASGGGDSFLERAGSGSGGIIDLDDDDFFADEPNDNADFDDPEFIPEKIIRAALVVNASAIGKKGGSGVTQQLMMGKDFVDKWPDMGAQQTPTDTKSDQKSQDASGYIFHKTKNPLDGTPEKGGEYRGAIPARAQGLSPGLGTASQILGRNGYKIESLVPQVTNAYPFIYQERGDSEGRGGICGFSTMVGYSSDRPPDVILVVYPNNPEGRQIQTIFPEDIQWTNAEVAQTPMRLGDNCGENNINTFVNTFNKQELSGPHFEPKVDHVFSLAPVNHKSDPAYQRAVINAEAAVIPGESKLTHRNEDPDQGDSASFALACTAMGLQTPGVLTGRIEFSPEHNLIAISPVGMIKAKVKGILAATLSAFVPFNSFRGSSRVVNNPGELLQTRKNPTILTCTYLADPVVYGQIMGKAAGGEQIKSEQLEQRLAEKAEFEDIKQEAMVKTINSDRLVSKFEQVKSTFEIVYEAGKTARELYEEGKRKSNPPSKKQVVKEAIADLPQDLKRLGSASAEFTLAEKVVPIVVGDLFRHPTKILNYNVFNVTKPEDVEKLEQRERALMTAAVGNIKLGEKVRPGSKGRTKTSEEQRAKARARVLAANPRVDPFDFE